MYVNGAYPPPDSIGHSSQESYLRGLGVAQFVAYDKENVAGKVRDVDVVLNMVDNQADAGMGYLRRGGTFSSIAEMPAEGKCQAAGATCVQIGRGMPGSPTVQTLRPLVAMAEAGAAWEYLSKSEGMGKTVLIVDAVRAGRR